MLDWLVCGLVSTVGWLLCRLPASVCVALGQGLGWAASWLQPKRMRVGSRNLNAAFGDRLKPGEAERIARRVFMNLGAGLVEMLRLPVIDYAYLRRYVHIAGEEHFDRAMASGRPVVLLTGHFGNWELSSIAAALKGHPIRVLAREQNQFPRLYRLMVSYRESKGCRVVHKGSAMRQLLRALDQREPVGIVGDQVSRQGIAVDLFGRPALFAKGPFELARSRHALIIPAFMHRLRGPYHRLVVEPPMELSSRGDPDEAVRVSVERFAAALARHITSDPSQWLWLHKRWKHTPARRVLVISDGKLGHLKQSLTVVQALKERSSGVQERVVEVRYRHRVGRALAVAWAWLAPAVWGRRWCLRLALEPASYAALATAYADIVVSCGAAAAPVNVLVSAGQGARSVVIMNPAPLPLRRFTLAFVPVHDRLPPRRNLVSTFGALSVTPNGSLAVERERLQRHPRFRAGPEKSRSDFQDLVPDTARAPRRAVSRGGATRGVTEPVIAVLLGGDTADYQLTAEFAASLMHHVLRACDELGGSYMVTTSRRTGADVERWLSEQVERDPRCRLLLLAGRDQLDGTMEGLLGCAAAVVVTADSVSMISEACASGRPVLVVEPPAAPSLRRSAKSRRYLSALAQARYIQRPSLSELRQAIRRSLSDGSTRRLETYATVRDAVARLL